MVTTSISVDVSQVVDDIEWLCVQLLERFPQGLGDRINCLEGFFSSIRDEVFELEDSPAISAGRIVFRFGVRGRAELLSTAIAALKTDFSQINRSHGALQ